MIIRYTKDGGFIFTIEEKPREDIKGKICAGCRLFHGKRKEAYCRAYRNRHTWLAEKVTIQSEACLNYTES